MANLNLSEFTEKLFVTDADHTFIWDTDASISKRVSRNSWLSGTTADFHLGLADAASPVAQTISVQSVVAGTTNTAGANLSINGSQGTGTGAGGSLLLRTAPAGSSGTAQNALVTAVAITSAGNVGIGTTAPGAKLDVFESTSNVAGLFLRATSVASPRFEFIDGATTPNRWSFGSGQVTTTDGKFFIYDARQNLNRFTIDTSGNVGIGTTSPSSKLHVEGNASPTITVANTSATGHSQLLFKNTVVIGDTDGIFLNGSAQAGFGGNGSLNIKATTGPIAFHTTSVTNALSIAQSGTCTHAGNLIFAPDNAYDIGASGANRPRNVYAGTSVNAAGIIIANNQVYRDLSSVIAFPSNGVIRLSNYLATDFSLLQLGGGTSSFPALKRSSTTLQARLADDSAFAPIQGKLTTDTAYTGTVVAATGYITIYDSTGTAYRVPCAV